MPRQRSRLNVVARDRRQALACGHAGKGPTAGSPLSSGSQSSVLRISTLGK